MRNILEGKSCPAFKLITGTKADNFYFPFGQRGLNNDIGVNFNLFYVKHIYFSIVYDGNEVVFFLKVG